MVFIWEYIDFICIRVQCNKVSHLLIFENIMIPLCSFKILVCRCVPVCMYVPMGIAILMWRSEDFLQESVLSVHHVGFKIWTQIIKLGNRYLCLSYFVTPPFLFFFFRVFVLQFLPPALSSSFFCLFSFVSKRHLFNWICRNKPASLFCYILQTLLSYVRLQ